MLAVRPADRRVASAVRRFPPGCGRPGNAAARKPPRPLPSATTTKRSLPDPTSAPLPGGTTVPAPPEVTVRRASAVRRYPPGCGRGTAVPKPPELVVGGEGEAAARVPPELVVEGEGEAAAGKLPALVREGEGEASVRNACDREAVLCECAIDDGDFSSDCGMEDGRSDADAGAREEEPWAVTDLMAAPAPFLRWAQHGRRSQRLKA